ncbi:cyclodeaminase/cyclohydrolase family protein [Microbacterium sp. 18062]|uniref:cyclodeaminase/cyclohydrolase family protein n=1 Tax=Microbacterium sp. 18062 TaxID=2681410 RepID=UPI00190F8C0C|nr:cyclodeaminase/cyclohydrolase family protein [Microbacterium sp. 18062]
MDESARTEAATIESVAVGDWLERLAGASGVPGGGAACALMAATAASLVGMVAGYVGDDEGERIVARAERGRLTALAEIERDARQSGRLGDALRENRDDSADAQPTVRAAAVASAGSAIGLGEVTASLLPDLEGLLDLVERYLVPDIVVAAEALTAGLSGAAAIARADLRLAASHGGAEGDDIGAVRSRLDALGDARTRADELRRTAAARV